MSGRRAVRVGGSTVVELVAAAATDGRVSVQEHRLARGAGAPAHAHTLEDQVVYVLEGEVALAGGGAERLLEAGDCALLRRSVPHSWTALSATACMLVVIVPGAFGDFWFDVGEPADLAEGGGSDPLPPGLPALLAERGVVLTGPAAP